MSITSRENVSQTNLMESTPQGGSLFPSDSFVKLNKTNQHVYTHVPTHILHAPIHVHMCTHIQHSHARTCARAHVFTQTHAYSSAVETRGRGLCGVHLWPALNMSLSLLNSVLEVAARKAWEERKEDR